MKVKEHFLSFQGTGVLAGELQYFIRLAGCKQPCPLRRVCDEPEALTRNGSFDMPKIENPSDWWHITGGEPLEQELAIYEYFSSDGRKKHLQTSGFVIPQNTAFFDWVSVSPKSPNLRLNFGNEMVLVNDPKWVDDDAAAHLLELSNFDNYFLLPIEIDGVFNIADTVSRIHRLGKQWRLACQMHKYMGLA